jgi:hypothetical protein
VPWLETKYGRYRGNAQSFSGSCSAYITGLLISGLGYKYIDTVSLTSQITLYMEPELHHRLSTMSISTAKVMKWLPRLNSFLLNNTRGPATPKPLSAPGSLKDTYEAACAWFLGPKAENADYLKMFVDIILNDLVQCRRNFSQDDQVRISISSS